MTVGDRQVFPFTDGIGQQAFVIVESRKPLPSFQEWSATAGDMAQAIKTTKGRWIWKDGSPVPWMEREVRGAPRDPKGGQEFANLFRNIESANPDVTLYAVSFPVEPR